ncbi:hypothetical protein ASG11_01560 [Sphingomonas sp. Leaf357]|nr:hypothetical protein ASG11_01560 [Sphingomonas sp. Leaf357]
MSLYRSFRLWTDEMQAGYSSGKLVYGIGTLPMFATPIIGRWWLVPSLMFAVGWFAFLLWRF